ncbi:uncharacterized protein LOC130979077 [Arachis stenosperma]|uniref:uncharacterized protein LOC130979077 n=1 Tax=Arachis stenosperma TaxID=217475 RepID=UPI0025AB8BE3|nr:uncharacterized protein LOC130979077 [Arachis stenosperma]XP_057758419.1 uncharacterized protein LOC130979077 [Arachis stenosperma]
MEEIREGRRAPVKGGARTIESREERKVSPFRVAAPTLPSGFSSPPSLLVVPLEVVAVDPCPCRRRELLTGIGAEGEGRVRRGSCCCRRRKLEELPSAAAVAPVAAVCRHCWVCHRRHLWSVTVEQIREERERTWEEAAAGGETNLAAVPGRQKTSSPPPENSAVTVARDLVAAATRGGCWGCRQTGSAIAAVSFS